MGTKMLLPTVLCVLLGYASATMPLEDLRSNPEFLNSEVDLERYRLPDGVYPTDVHVDLDVDLVAAEFTGLVNMNVVVTGDDVTEIVLHQKVVEIETAIVLNGTGHHVNLRPTQQLTFDDYLEIMSINFASALPKGNYSITIPYKGKINENVLDRGFYRGYYFFNGERRYYATTQFQPFHARKAFPCFDEPRFKSRFVISITRAGNLRESYSNMDISDTTPLDNGRVRETFYPTPLISAYLVAFHVSDFVPTQNTSTPLKKFRIIAREGPQAQHQYASEIGVKITDELDDYLGIQYVDMGQGVPMKNDHIALPDFPSGAMENWGMVNYREAYLLYDPANTNLQSKIFIATIMAHELGHKWFGNLVTCFWWSNLWLNESFASFFEYFAAHWADPSLELDDQFVVDYVHSALNHDSGTGAQPMNWTGVASNPSITAHFSPTSYAKGASVLRMMEHLVGPRIFRNALRYYLRDRAYDIGTPEDMYAAFKRATDEDWQFKLHNNFEIGPVFDSWVQNAGSPVIEVNRNSETGNINVAQKRYLIDNTSPPQQIWQIPLTFTHQGELNFRNTTPSHILSEASMSVSGNNASDFVIFNIAQSGLYRVSYDDRNWEQIADYLKSNNENRESIHKLNRAQIVNDVLYFIRSGHINTTLGFEVLEFLRSETDYYVWNGALTQLEWIRRRLEHIPRAQEAFTNYMLALMDNVINHLGYNERETDSTSTILNRAQIMNVACNLGHEGCIADSLQKWRDANLANNSIPVPVNLRRHVYCVGVREGNVTEFNTLLSWYDNSENTADMVVMLRALGCTRHQALIQSFLTQTMQNDRIRLHDRPNAFAFALQGNRENVPVVLNFLSENYQAIADAYGGVDRLNLCINHFTTHLTTFAQIEAFQQWVYSAQEGLASSSFNAGVGVVASARGNLDWGNEAALEIFNFAVTRGASSTILASTILIFAAMLLQLLR